MQRKGQKIRGLRKERILKKGMKRQKIREMKSKGQESK